MIQPILGGLACILLTYLIGEKIKPGSGIYAAALLATAHHFLFFSHWLGGVSLSIAFILLSFYLSLQEKHTLSGAFLILSLITRISHFPILLIFFAYNIYKKQYKFFLGFFAAAIASLTLLLIPGFYTGTVLYHLTKKAGVLSIGYGGYLSFAQRQFIPVILTILSAAYVLKSKIKNLPLLFSFLAVLSGFGLLLLSELRVWYIVYTIPFLCITSGFLFQQLSRIKINKKSLKIPLTIFFIILLIFSFRPAYNSTKYSEEETYDPVYDLLQINSDDYLLDTLAGMGPYLSLKHDASISGNLIDMNPLRFANDLFDTDDAISKLNSQPPKYIFDLRGGTGELISWDHYWRFTPLRDHIYDNYRPHFLTYNEDLFTLTLIWEKQALFAYQKVEFRPALYNVKFLDKHEIVDRKVDTHYLTTQRLSNTTDHELTHLVDGLTEVTLNKRQLICHDAWDDFDRFHTIVKDGDLRCETWITPHDGNILVFTETTENDITVSFTAMELDQEAGVWNSLVIYENIIGGLVPTYSETLYATVE